MASWDRDSPYFSKPYVPLSNLPTPPRSPEMISIQSSLGLGTLKNPELLGPAIHLANLVPSAVSIREPDPRVVYDLLVRAALPQEIIALACCILDCLDSHFAATWRRRCPKQKVAKEYSASMYNECILPEIIILSALILAVKFQDDCEASSQKYAMHWGLGAWTAVQLNTTEQCILGNLGYRIMPLWKEELLRDALLDMQCAGMRTIYGSAWTEAMQLFAQAQTEAQNAPMSNGRAVWTSERQLTPAATPTTHSLSRTRSFA
ncbi:MAG: hypothetical protein M1818_000494 [Claussenomyces sp. TS43310]|nr:MAG: hypothetical protein M1818_000494 [Claussenomyces sp. TS43310]